ncbi:MAG TPA: VTT domain-containing protein [Pyrinomonadaceae bacterium]|nr:VTT domain-containing protein [Pyrinomonadaceae bacterium]
MLLLIIGLGERIRAIAEGLQRFIVEVPIYIAAPSMVIIGALDSSLLSLPEINDYLVVMRCYSDPKAAFYFPLFAALGSVIGCMLLYVIMRRGGQAILRKRFRAEHIERVERAYARFGVLTLAIPALLPPPMPFKIFVATAGALEYPRWRFMLTIMIARSVRYFVEGALAVYYGRQVLEFIENYGLKLLGTVAALCVVGLAVYFIKNRLSGSKKSETGESETVGESGETQSDADAPSSTPLS